MFLTCNLRVPGSVFTEGQDLNSFTELRWCYLLLHVIDRKYTFNWYTSSCVCLKSKQYFKKKKTKRKLKASCQNLARLFCIPQPCLLENISSMPNVFQVLTDCLLWQYIYWSCCRCSKWIMLLTWSKSICCAVAK